MNQKEFCKARKKLGKTQKQMAELLGVSLKAVHSYEQRWRHVPAHVERQMFFLIVSKEDKTNGRKPCWIVKDCPSERKAKCPAWEFSAGKLCWFVNGTICDGLVHKNWKKKMEICRTCDVLSDLL